jgi:hypothetical protein
MARKLLSIATIFFFSFPNASTCIAQTKTDAPKIQVNCTRQLISSRSIPDPLKAWNSDTSFMRGYKEDASGMISLYIVGDKLNLTKEELQSLFRTRNQRNTKVNSIVFDAREINFDMPIVFDTTTVTFYAKALRIGPRASIVFTEPPSKIDGVNIIADSLDLTESPLHPFVFVTRENNWPATTNRLVTVVSNNIKLRVGTQLPSDKTTLARDLSLDENYASFTSPTDQLKAYSVEIGTAAAHGQFQKYAADTMVWPLETAEKIARQFSNAPFDEGNTAFLKGRIAALYDALPSGSHSVARSVLARTSHAIDAKVDNLGFYQYYVPRIAFSQVLAEFVSLQANTLTTLEAWDKEIVAAQKGSDLTGIVQSLDSNVGGLKSKLVSDQQSIDEAVNQLAVTDNTILSLSQTVDRYENEIKAQIEDDKKKQETNKNIAIGTKVVVLAASLIPVSAPVAIAIGTAAGVAGNQILQFNEGQSPDLAGALTSIPDAMTQAKDFHEKTSKLVKQWGTVKEKFAAYNKPASPDLSQSQALPLPPPNNSTDGPKVDQKPTNAKEEFGSAVGDFTDDLTAVLNSVKSPQPTVTKQNDYEQKNAPLQQALHDIGDLRNSEAAVFSKLDSLRKEVLSQQDQINQLEEKRAQLSHIDLQNDRDRALRQSLGWAVRQDELRRIAYNAVVLSRAYKYHTGQNLNGTINEQYFSSTYRLSGAIEQASDSTNDFFRTAGRNTLEATLTTQRQQLDADLKAYVGDLRTGYSMYVEGIAKHNVHTPEYTLTCRGMARTDPRCIFLTAVNDEIATQVMSTDTNRRPIKIPIPLQIRRSFRPQPEKLLDIQVGIEYEDPKLASDKSIEFSVEHPFFGKLWGEQQNDCWLADMRKYDAVENLQPYVTTCNNNELCTHDPVKLTEDFLSENAKHAPLPVDTTYFFEPSVQDRGAQSKIPRLKTIRLKYWIVE